MGEITRYSVAGAVTTGTAETVVLSCAGPPLLGQANIATLPSANAGASVVRVRAMVLVVGAGTAAAGFLVRVRRNTVGGGALNSNTVSAGGTGSASNGGAQPVASQVLICDFYDTAPVFPTTYVITVSGWTAAGTVVVTAEVEAVS